MFATAAFIAFATFGAGTARAVDTLSWSFAASTVDFCNFGSCGIEPLLVAGHSDSSGTNFNAAAVSLTPHGNAVAWADPGDSGLLADLHAVAVAFGPLQTPGQFNIAFAAVEGVQVYQWTGGSFDLDPTDFIGSMDYHADNAAAGPSGIVAGFAILDGSVLGDNSLATPWFNFGLNAGGFVADAFQGDCATPGAVGIANTGFDRRVGTNTLTIGATACHGKLHLEAGDEFVLWSKLFVDRSSPGAIDASHTFHVEFDPATSAETIQTFASSIAQQDYAYAVPETATWMTMILGFCGIGTALRSRPRRTRNPLHL